MANTGTSKQIAASLLGLAFMVAAGHADAAPKKNLRPTHKPAATQKVTPSLLQKLIFNPNKEPEACSAVYVMDMTTGTVLEDKNSQALQDWASVNKVFPTLGLRLMQIADEQPPPVTDEEREAAKNLLTGDTRVTVANPNKGKAKRKAHMEWCDEGPPVATRTETYSLKQLYNGIMGPSHNLLANAAGEFLVKRGNYADFKNAMEVILTGLGLPIHQMRLSSDSTGLDSAKDCHPGKAPGERGTLLSAEHMLSVWQIFYISAGKDLLTSLSTDASYSFLDEILNNTNFLRGYIPGVRSVMKTGSVTDMYAAVDTSTVEHDTTANFKAGGTREYRAGQSISMALVCPTKEARKAKGKLILRDLLPLAAVPQPMDHPLPSEAMEPAKTTVAQTAIDPGPQNTP